MVSSMQLERDRWLIACKLPWPGSQWQSLLCRVTQSSRIAIGIGSPDARLSALPAARNIVMSSSSSSSHRISFASPIAPKPLDAARPIHAHAIPLYRQSRWENRCAFGMSVLTVLSHSQHVATSTPPAPAVEVTYYGVDMNVSRDLDFFSAVTVPCISGSAVQKRSVTSSVTLATPVYAGGTYSSAV